MPEHRSCHNVRLRRTEVKSVNIERDKMTQAYLWHKNCIEFNKKTIDKR